MKVKINYKVTNELARELAFNEGNECPVSTEQVLEYYTNRYDEINKLISLGAVVNEGTITLDSPWLYELDGNRRKWKERKISYLIHLLEEEDVPFFLERLEADIAASNRYGAAIKRFKDIVGDSMSGLLTHAIADERITEEDLIVLVGVADKISAMHPRFLEETFALRGFVEDTLRAMARAEIIDSLDIEAAREIEKSYPQWREDYMLSIEEKLRKNELEEAQEQYDDEINPDNEAFNDVGFNNNIGMGKKIVITIGFN